ncbi:hypothetical protein HMPREF9374_1231 [Desmospora sp. 8437]|nr:hypothetical protein HMPREF9374_1231 [Desmospora sp. 8437]
MKESLYRFRQMGDYARSLEGMSERLWWKPRRKLCLIWFSGTGT